MIGQFVNSTNSKSEHMTLNKAEDDHRNKNQLFIFFNDNVDNWNVSFTCLPLCLVWPHTRRPQMSHLGNLCHAPSVLWSNCQMRGNLDFIKNALICHVVTILIAITGYERHCHIIYYNQWLKSQWFVMLYRLDLRVIQLRLSKRGTFNASCTEYKQCM